MTEEQASIMAFFSGLFPEHLQWMSVVNNSSSLTVFRVGSSQLARVLAQFHLAF